MRISDIATQILSALDELPSDPDEIAQTLLERGHHGGHEPHNCPMAEYLRSWLRTLGNAQGNEPWFVRAYANHTIIIGAIATSRIEFPSHVQAFISRHDSGKYPLLEGCYRS